MKVIIHGEWEQSEILLSKVKNILDELWLVDFITIDTTNDEALKKELDIKESPALIIEEEAIDFKDTIFEGIIPDDEEIKAMFTSIIWWWEWGGCAPGGCGSWCSC